MSDLKLPIDVVDPKPGVRGKTFRWSYTSDGPTGRKVIPCEGAMQPSAEAAITDLIATAKTLHARLYGKDGALEVAAKLQAFKTWVHAYLDSKGVPRVFPHGPHTREGCRIGDRLDWLIKSQSGSSAEEALRAENAALLEQLEEARARSKQSDGAEEAAELAARGQRRGRK